MSDWYAEYPVNYKQIDSIGWSHGRQILIVFFASGDEYRYYDVPNQIFLEFLGTVENVIDRDTAEGISPMRYFVHNIRNEYQYKRVEDE